MVNSKGLLFFKFSKPRGFIFLFQNHGGFFADWRGLRRFFPFFFQKNTQKLASEPIIFWLIGEFSIFIFETKRMLQDKVSTTEFLSSLQKTFLNRKRKRSPSISTNTKSNYMKLSDILKCSIRSVKA